MSDIKVYEKLCDLSSSQYTQVFFSFTCTKKFTKMLRVFRQYALIGDFSMHSVYVVRSKYLLKAYPQLSGLFYAKYFSYSYW